MLPAKWPPLITNRTPRGRGSDARQPASARIAAGSIELGPSLWLPSTISPGESPGSAISV